jgi:hypothetical protein
LDPLVRKERVEKNMENGYIIEELIKIKGERSR